uniref:hypothetical protein n=1 Tax=Crenothrix polyspora TaxID=360316 RepID=UPI0015C599E8|nr:hypothetical protein [Crenothrix polyspora]
MTHERFSLSVPARIAAPAGERVLRGICLWLKAMRHHFDALPKGAIPDPTKMAQN